jgi:hypothetical protein
MGLCPFPLAMMIAKGITWRKAGIQQGVDKVMRRVAYATRYGGATLTEAMGLDQLVLQDFIEAVAEIVREENKSSRS